MDPTLPVTIDMVINILHQNNDDNDDNDNDNHDRYQDSDNESYRDDNQDEDDDLPELHVAADLNEVVDEDDYDNNNQDQDDDQDNDQDNDRDDDNQDDDNQDDDDRDDDRDDDNSLDLNEKEYISYHLSTYFNLININDMNDVILNNYSILRRLCTIKKKNNPVTSNWFTNNEIIKNEIGQNDLLIYIIQLISETSIEIMTNLQITFTNNNDNHEIINISSIVQNWINTLEINNNVINVSVIKNFNALLYWVFIMISNIKYVSSILSLPSCPKELFEKDYLLREANNINLMFMSLYNEDIRSIIINNIGISKYTELLNERVSIKDNNTVTCNVQYIDLSVYFGTLINMLKNNDIDISKLKIEDDTLLTLFCKTINCRHKINFIYVKPFIKNTVNMIFTDHILSLPQNVIDYFKQIKYIDNDIHNSINNIRIFNNNLTILEFISNSYFDILCKFVVQIYDDLNQIIDIPINKNKPYDLLFMLIAYNRNNILEEKLLSINKVHRILLFNYASVCISNFLNIPEINDVYNKIINLYDKTYDTNNISYLNYLRLYNKDFDQINEEDEEEISTLVNTIDDFKMNHFMYYNIKKYNNSYYHIITKYFSETKFISFVEGFDRFINNYSNKLFNIKYIQLYSTPIESFIKSLLFIRSPNESNNNIDDILVNLFAKYIIIGNNTNNIIDKIYEIQTEDSKKYLIDLFISNCITNQALKYNNNYDIVIDKYFVNICNLININNTHSYFEILARCMQNHTNKLICTDLISNDIKFGNEFDDSKIIDNILSIIKTDQDLTSIKDIDTYKYNNCIRIINTLTNLFDSNYVDSLFKIFNIDDDFISIYKIKSMYLEKISNNQVSVNNFSNILKHINYTVSDVGDILNLLKMFDSTKSNNMLLSLLLINLINNSNISHDIMESLLVKTILIRDKLIPNIKEFYLKIITNYNNNKNILMHSLTKYFNVQLTIDDINNINKIFPDYVKYLNLTDIKLESNIINLIKYLENDIIYCSELISKYHKKFIDTKLLTFNDKIKIITNIGEYLSNRIPNILLNERINNLEKLDDDTINNIINMCNKFNIVIPNKLIDAHPELIHGIKEFSTENIDMLTSYVDNYDNFIKIISCSIKSDTVFNILKDKLKNSDIDMYIELLVNYNYNLQEDDINIILSNISNDINLLKYIISNDNTIKLVFNNDYYKICKLTNNIDNYSLSMINNLNIDEFIKYYTLDDLKLVNKHNNPRLFGFLNNKDNIKTIIDIFGIDNLVDIKDINGFNIYNKIIDLDICDEINNLDIINNIKITKENMIIMMTKLSSQNITKIVEKLSNNEINNILIFTDNDNNKTSYYLALYHQKLFKKLLTDKVIKQEHFSVNFNNETFLMKLIKESTNFDLEPLIKWIINNCDIDISDCFADYNSGSVITYCLKYNNNLTKLFMSKDNIFNNCMNIYDSYSMICPYSDYAKSGNLQMNLLQIACIVDHNILAHIIKSYKKKSSYMMKENIISGDMTYNILHIALFNNPESVQVLLGTNLFDMQYIKATEQVIDKFEKVIDVQPASWYYLIQALHNKYELTLNLDEHWYGYNFKQKLTSPKIKSVTHYILDKQELGTNKNTCNICETYSNKVVFTKCHHKVCISCAVKSNKCGTCRTVIKDDEKIKI